MSPPPSVFSTAEVEISFAQSTFGEIVTGDLNIKAKPQIIALATKASADARIREYMRCLAIHRDKFSHEQAAYFDLMNSFLSTGPTPEQFLKFQEDNRFPRRDVKAE